MVLERGKSGILRMNVPREKADRDLKTRSKVSQYTQGHFLQLFSDAVTPIHTVLTSRGVRRLPGASLQDQFKLVVKHIEHILKNVL